MDELQFNERRYNESRIKRTKLDEPRYDELEYNELSIQRRNVFSPVNVISVDDNLEEIVMNGFPLS